MRSAFEAALADKHAETVKALIDILARRFCDGDGFEGAEAWNPDNRVLRQRDLSAVVQDAIVPFI
ncbi:MAG: hypothetical protein GDA36_02705 [Rhodobacteraceae bacterium]|nr:hypothetical protein [Paracoccaceae bacterium]